MVKNSLICLLLAVLTLHAVSQTVTNIVMVGPNGRTEDPEKATAFIVIKQYPDLHFERLDYKKGGPLVKVRSYKDQDLKILEGRYFEYAVDGTLSMVGKFTNNLRNGWWVTLDDSGKVITSTRYSNDSLVEVRDVNRKDSVMKYGDERVASFPGGQKAWKKFLLSGLEKENPVDKSFHSGVVYINFAVGMDGTVEDLSVSKSAEYILDETSLKIIASSPKWTPAFRNGKNWRDYRRQPLTFTQGD
jgi:hypothetical protein